MPAQHAFNYAIIRVVPKVERQEFLNAGVVMFCRTLNYLGVMLDAEPRRLATMFPSANLKMVQKQLKSIKTICSDDARAGYFAQLSKSERFSWLAAPSSSIIQLSPIHSGICEDPEETLQKLYDLFVA